MITPDRERLGDEAGGCFRRGVHGQFAFPGHDQNIGVLLGSPSNGLLDIDLDCVESCLMAPTLLTPTACRFGRRGKPKSHMLYRVDGESDAIAVIGTFVGRLEGKLGLGDPPQPREFAIAIESFTPDTAFSPNLGVRLWFGDQALARAMNLPIDTKPNRVEFDGVETAVKMIKDLMFAESSFVALRGDTEPEDLT